MSLAGSRDREASPSGLPPPDSDASTVAPNLDGTNWSGPKPASSSGSGDYGTPDVAQRNEEVHQLARRFTERSTYSTNGQNPFAAAPGSALDPNGENFNARAWCKAMLQMHTEDSEAHPLRTVGVSFSNLNVHGFGSDTDFQKSVGNIWLEGIGLAKKVLGYRQRKIEILQNLDGLVEAGEMLVVLGPPGSGCSTFLKTLTSETHGFFVDEGSNINFQGMCSSIFHVYVCAGAFYTDEKNFTFRYQRKADGKGLQGRSYLHC